MKTHVPLQMMLVVEACRAVEALKPGRFSADVLQMVGGRLFRLVQFSAARTGVVFQCGVAVLVDGVAVSADHLLIVSADPT